MKGKVAEAYGAVRASNRASAMDSSISPDLSVYAPQHEILNKVSSHQGTVDQGKKNRQAMILRVSKSLCAIYPHANPVKRFTKVVKERKERTTLPLVHIDTNGSAWGIQIHNQMLAHKSSASLPGCTRIIQPDSYSATLQRYPRRVEIDGQNVL